MRFASKKVYFRKNSLEEEAPEEKERLELSLCEDDLEDRWSDASDSAGSDNDEDDEEEEVEKMNLDNDKLASSNQFHTFSNEEEKKEAPKKKGGIFGFFSRNREADPKSEKKKPKVKKEKKKRVLIARSAESEAAQRRFKTRVDFNVVSVDMASLKEESELATGDAVFCSKCSAAFSSHSAIKSKSEVMQTKAMEEDAKMEELPGGVEEPQVWVCEFCANSNEVNLEEEEKPKSNKINYILESVAQVQEKHEEDDISIIFCIDISGSMCVTTPVKGKLKFKGDKKDDWAELNRNFGDGSLQYLPQEDQNVTWVSRLQCVKAAIEAQLLEMAQTYPNRRVGIVTFNSEVSVHGDGSQSTHIITGDKLSNFEVCKKEGGDLFETFLSQKIETTKDQLVKKLDSLEETGPTALGPALLSSVAMASKGKAGSQVIMCTDGLANVGLGSFEGKSEAEIEATLKFYKQIGDIAEDSNVRVNVVSILGEECKLTALSEITERTSGEVLRVNPENLTQEFSNILSNPVIATQVTVKLMLHRGLKFRNEEEHDLNDDQTVMTRKLGNVNEDTEFTFEFAKRETEELVKRGISVEDIEKLPFQTQIYYTTLDGMKCIRVTTEIVEISEKIEEVEKEADIAILGVNAARQASRLAKAGDYRAAQATAHSWKVQLDRVSEMTSQRSAFNDYKHNMGQLHSDLANIYEEEQADSSTVALESSGVRQMRRNDSFSEKLSKASKMNTKKSKARWSKK